MATSCIRGAAPRDQQPALLARSLARSSALYSSGDRLPAPELRCPTPPCPKDRCSSKAGYRYSSGPNTSPSPRSRERGKKVLRAAGRKPASRGRNTPASEQPRPRPGGSARLPGTQLAGFERSAPGAPSPRQGTYLALAFERAGCRGFHLGFQTSFRDEEGGEKNPIMQTGSGLGGARWVSRRYCTGSRAAPDRADLCGRVTATPGPAAGASRS